MPVAITVGVVLELQVAYAVTVEPFVSVDAIVATHGLEGTKLNVPPLTSMNPDWKICTDWPDGTAVALPTEPGG